jgi:hypothetical protein
MLDARTVLGLGCFLLVCALGGCSREPASPRLALRGLETKLLVGDAPLELSGDALPPGDAIVVALHGVMHAPGRGDRSVELSLTGSVLSPERLIAQGDPSASSVLGRGSFDGQLEVRCAAAATPCFGSLPRVHFDIDAPSVRSFEPLRRAAQTLLVSLGFEIADDAPRSQGLLIARVSAGGRAARAGLRAGDVIEVSNGVRIHALGDLAPAANVSLLHWQVRSAAGEHRALTLPLSAAAPFLDAHLVGLYALACPMLLLLLWLAPWPTPGELLTRTLAALRSMRPRAAFGTSKLEVVLPCVLAGAAALLGDRLDVFAILLVHLAVVLAVCARRTTHWSAALVHLGAIWLSVGAVAAISGTRSWSVFLAQQGALPWEWNLFARPPLALAAALCVWHATRLPAAFAREPAAVPSGKSARALDLFARSLLAMLFAALFLGGSRSGAGVGPESIAIGAALLGAKSLLVLGLLGLQGAPGQLPRRANRTALAALLALSSFWLWLAPGRPFELALGGGVCVFLMLGLLMALVERRLARGATPSLHARTAQPG